MLQLTAEEHADCQALRSHFMILKRGRGQLSIGENPEIKRLLNLTNTMGLRLADEEEDDKRKEA